MARTPEFVVTGLHVPAVHFRARVLVTPERLQQVKEGALQRGQIFLNPGEVLQIDTRPDDVATSPRRALTVKDDDAKTLRAMCLVAWNELGGDITIYGDDADRLASIAQLVGDALSGEPCGGIRGLGAWLHASHLTSIQVGDVHVFFPRRGEEEKFETDEPAAQDPDRYPSSFLKAGEKLRAQRGTAIRSGRSA